MYFYMLYVAYVCDYKLYLYAYILLLRFKATMIYQHDALTSWANGPQPWYILKYRFAYVRLTHLHTNEKISNLHLENFE